MHYLVTILCLLGLNIARAASLTESVSTPAAVGHAGRPPAGNYRDGSYDTRKTDYKSALSARDVDDFEAVLLPRGKNRPNRPRLGNNSRVQDDEAIPSGEQQRPPGQAPMLLRGGTAAPWRQRVTLMGKAKKPPASVTNEAATRPADTRGVTAIRTPREQPGRRSERLIDSPSTMHESRPFSPQAGSLRRASRLNMSPQDVLSPGFGTGSSHYRTPSPESTSSRPAARTAEEELRRELSWLAKGKWTAGTRPFDGQPFGMTGEHTLRASGQPPSALQRQRQETRAQAPLSGYAALLSKQPDETEGDMHRRIHAQYEEMFGDS